MYATLEDLVLHLGATEAGLSGLPADANRNLEYASDTIDAHTLGRIRPIEDAEVAKRATLAQYDMMIATGGMDAVGSPDSFSIMSFSASYSGGMPDLAPRARRILLNAGLLYRGVGAR